MPLVEVIDSNTFPSDFLASKASNSSTATESVSSDNIQPVSPRRSPNRMTPGSPHRSPIVHTSPHRSPIVHTSPHRSPGMHGSPLPNGSPSDRGMVHTRTNFGKTRGYVPPVIPSSPGRITVDAPMVPSSYRQLSSNPFQEEADAPDDEAKFRTVRSLRPKPAQYHSDGSNNKSPYRNGRLHRRHNSATRDVTASPPRPEAYISETDESSMGQRDLSYEPRTQRVPSPSQDARQPSPEAPYDIGPTRSQGKEVRHPSPIENIESSRIRSTAKSQSVTGSSPQRTADELGDPRRRRRLSKNKKQTQQFEMPEPEVVEQDTPMRVTSTKTSDLTDDTALDPVPSFDGNSVVHRLMESELEYHEDVDTLPPPAESPSYEEFETGREASLSPQKCTKPKSILRTKRYSSAESDVGGDDDDDSLFNFGEDSSLGNGIVRKSSLQTGTNSNNRRGRRTRRRPEETANDDDESLIQYGEHHKRSSSLQERTQEAWTFRSKRSFSASASPKKESAGVQFGNTDTIHHFDDQATLQTAGSYHSLNSLYTKSPESEAEDLIKDLLMIGSGQHSNPGRRKLKYQPVYKRELNEKGDERSIDDNTLGTTDISLNTLDYHTGTRGPTATRFTRVTPNVEATEHTSPETSPDKSNSRPKTSRDTLEPKDTMNDDSDPLAFVWNYVESGMQALGLALAAEKEKKITEEEKKEKEEQNASISKKSKSEEEAADGVLPKEADALEAKASDVVAVATSGTTDDYPDEVKEDAKGSFSEVMDYFFGDPTQKDKDKTKQSLVSSAGSAVTTSTPLEDDPRLEELALHAVKSRHQMYDMEYDESFPVDIEKDIKFSVVKMKLPLGILFHENDGGCWITKVFPDGNAAKAGGVEVGDQLAAINGTSAIKLRVDQICTLITEAPDTSNIELTFLRYIGKLHPLVPDMVESFESFEVTNVDALMKPPIKRNPPKSLRALSKLRSPSPKPKKSPELKKDLRQKPSKAEAKGKAGLGKWFGKGKKKSHPV